jgi:hypothetical protein
MVALYALAGASDLTAAGTDVSLLTEAPSWGESPASTLSETGVGDRLPFSIQVFGKPEDSAPPVVGGGTTVYDLPGEWALWRLLSGTEKRTARYLNALGTPYCLPLRSNETCSGGKRRTSLLPAIPGYLCVAGGDDGLEAMHDYRSRHPAQVFRDPTPVRNRPKFLRELDGLVQTLSLDPYLAINSGIAAGAFASKSWGRAWPWAT